MLVIGPLWFVIIVIVLYYIFRSRPNSMAHAATKWVTYEGITPPLRFNLRFEGSNEFREAIAHYVSAAGYSTIEQLSEEEQEIILARAYSYTFITDWDMAGTPYDINTMAQMLLTNDGLYMFLMSIIKKQR